MKQALCTHVQLKGLSGQTVPCESFHGTDLGYNSRYVLMAKGVTNSPFTSHDLEQCSLHISSSSNIDTYHGELLTLHQSCLDNGKIEFICTIGCSLHRLNNDTNQQFFINKTLKDIIDELLKNHGINAVYKLEGLDYILPYTAQGGVSDYDFLLRLCETHGIVFYYQHNEQQASLIFTNQLTNDAHHALIFNPGNGLLDEPKGVITSLIHWRMSLPDSISLQGAREDDPDVIFKHQTSNQTDIPGQGTLTISHQFTLLNEDDCKRYAQILQEQLDWQRELIKITLSDKTVQVGNTISIANHPDEAIKKRIFRVVAETMSSDQTETNAAHSLQTTAYLTPAELHYRMPCKFTRMNWPEKDEVLSPQCHVQAIKRPTASLAIGEVCGDDMRVSIDELGRYNFRPFFTENKSESHMVRMLQPAQGFNDDRTMGMHMTIPPTTRVIMAHLYNHVDKPIILGVVPDAEQPSPVNEDNYTSLILRHTSGAGLEFEDTANQQKLSLHAANEQHGLGFVKKEEAESVHINSIGDVDFNAKTAMNLFSGRDMSIEAQSALFQCEETQTISAKKDLLFKAKSINLQAGNDYLSHSKSGNFAMNAKKEVNISATQIDIEAAQMKLHADNCIAKAQTSITLQTSKGIRLNVQASLINLSSPNLSLQSPRITLDAKAIVKNQGVLALVKTSI